MNQLLSLKLRTATDLDVETFENQNIEKKKVVLESRECVIEIDVPKKKDVDAPTLEEINVKSDEVEVKYLSLEDIEKLKERLPPFDLMTQEGDFLQRTKTILPLPKNEKTISIKFPPTDQLKRSEDLSNQKKNVELFVNTYSPSSSIHDLTTPLSITFSQVMYKSEFKSLHKKEEIEKDLKKQKDMIEKMIIIKPPLPEKGIWKWTSPTRAIFEPQKQHGKAGLLCGSTEYKVVIPTGTESFDGCALRKTVKFSFSTPNLFVHNFCPSYVSSPIPTKEPLLGIHFSQDVSAVDIMKNVFLKQKGGLLKKKMKLKLLTKVDVLKKLNEEIYYTTRREVRVNPGYCFPIKKHQIEVEEEVGIGIHKKKVKKFIDIFDDYEKNLVFFTPTERLSPDKQYDVTIQNGLEGIRGNLKSLAKYSYSFHTISNLQVIRNDIPSERYEHEHVHWKIQFNNYLNKKEYEMNKKEWVKLENIQNATVWMEKDLIHVKGRIRKDKNFATVKLGPTIEDNCYSQLGKERIFKVKIIERDFQVISSCEGKQLMKDDVDWRIHMNWNIKEDHFNANKEELLVIDPPLKFQKVRVIGSSQIQIRGNPIGKKKFKITLKKEVQNSYETCMKKDRIMKVSISKEDPILQAQHSNTMIVHDCTNQSIPIGYRYIVRNIDKLKVIVYKVDPLNDYHKCPFGKFGRLVKDYKKVTIYDIIGLSKKKIVHDKEVKTECVYNEKKEIVFELSKFLDKRIGHLLVVVVNPKNISRSLMCWIQSTKLAFETVFTNDNSVTLIGNSLETGKFLTNPKFSFAFYKKTNEKKEGSLLKTVYSYSNFEIDQIPLEGDENGLCTFDLSPHKMKLFQPNHGLDFNMKKSAKKKASKKYYYSNMILLRSGNDLCFNAHLNKRPLENSIEKDRLIKFVFDDKKMFKPKDKFTCKAILRVLTFKNRERKLKMLPEGLTFNYEILDGRSVKFREGELKVDKVSSLFFNFIIPDDINTGNCTVRFWIDTKKIKDQKYIGKEFTHNFTVEEYEPPEFDTACKLFPKSYCVGDKAIVTASAKYYSGGFLSDSNVSWNVYQSIKSNWKPPGNYGMINFGIESEYHRNIYPGYKKYSDEPRRWYNFAEKTDDKGEHKLLLELNEAKKYWSEWDLRNHDVKIPSKEKEQTKMKKFDESEVVLPLLYEKSKTIHSPIELKMVANIRDISQNNLNCDKTFIVHGCLYYIGLQHIKKSFYSGDTIPVNFIVTTQNGNVVEGKDVVFEVFKNRKKMKVIRVKSGSILKKVNIEMYSEWGIGKYTFCATILDEHDRFSVSTLSYQLQNKPYNLENHEDIKKLIDSLKVDYPLNYRENKVPLESVFIASDKVKYFVDDEMKLVLKCPFNGDGMLIIFANRVVHKQKFCVDECKKEKLIEIKVSPNFIPNVEVFVYMIGSTYRKDINDFKVEDENISNAPSHARGNLKLQVSPSYYEIKVEAKTKENVYPPGASVDINIQTSKGKSVATVLVVDESVLDLSGYDLNLTMDDFYPNNKIRTMEYFLRSEIFLRKWKANLEKVEKEKKRLQEEIEKRKEETKRREIERKRRDEEKRMIEKEERRLEEDKRKKSRKKRKNERRRKRSGSRSRSRSRSRSGSRSRSRSSRKSSRSRSSSRSKSRSKSRSRSRGKSGKEKEKSFIGDIKNSQSHLYMKKSANFGLGLPSFKIPKFNFFGKKSKALDSHKLSYEIDDTESLEKDIDFEVESGAMFYGEMGESKEDVMDEPVLPISVRKVFESTVIFAHSIETDVLGKAVVKMKLPDSLTRYKIYCIAELGADYFGFSNASIVAKLPFSLRPAIPSFLNFNDHAQLSFILSNQTEKTIKVNVTMRCTPNIQIMEEKHAGFIVQLPQFKRKEIKFSVFAAQVGSGMIQIVASGPKYTDAIQKNIPIYTPTINTTFAFEGELNDTQSHVQEITPPISKDVHESYGGIELIASSTLFQSLSDAFLYTYKFMYDNVECAANRILSITSMIDVVHRFKLRDFDKKERIIIVMKSALTKLANSQKKFGGFGLFNAESKHLPYVSVHVAHSVIRCREKFPNLFTDENRSKIYQRLLEKCKEYLIGITKYFPFGYRKNSTRSIRSYGLYVLSHYAKLKLLTDKEIHACSKRVNKLVKEMGNKGTNESLAWLCFSLYQFSKDGNKMDKNVIKILKSINKSLVSEKNATYYKGRCVYKMEEVKLIMIGYSNVRENAAILEMLCHVNSSDIIIPKLAKWLLKMKRFNKWENINVNSNVLLALSTYITMFEKEVPNYETKVWINNDYCGEIIFKGRENEFKTLKIPIKNVLLNDSEREKIELKKKDIQIEIEKTKKERIIKEEEIKKKEKLEVKKREENMEKKKKSLFGSMSNTNTADDDMDFFSNQIEKRKRILRPVEEKEQKQQSILNDIINRKMYIQKKGKGRMYYRISMKYAPKDMHISAYNKGFSLSRTFQFIGDIKTHRDDIGKDVRTGVYLAKHGEMIRVVLEFSTDKTRYNVALCDMIPAGFIVLNPNIKRNNVPKDLKSSLWYDHVNYRQERVEVFKETLQPGKYYFSFVCRANTLGRFICSPAIIEETYNPEICGICDSDFVHIIKKIN